MSLKTAKNVIRYLLVACVAVAILGVALAAQHSPNAVYASLVSFILFAVAIIMLFAFGKCPHCGKRIIKGLYSATYCPHCRRDLITGVRKKGKGGKKVKHH